MTAQQQYATALAGCISAIALLLVATAISLATGAGQEIFETIRNPAAYGSELAAADQGLRAILFIDTLFIPAYVTAIGFAMTAFASSCRPAAWIAGIGILAVALLDVVENTIMVQSLDLALLGILPDEGRITWQAFASALKWQVAALSLFAAGFVLPRDSSLEKLLVWGVRIGLPLSVPLFVMDAFGMREAAPILIGVSMLGGLALLAMVLRGRLSKA